MKQSSLHLREGNTRGTPLDEKNNKSRAINFKTMEDEKGRKEKKKEEFEK